MPKLSKQKFSIYTRNFIFGVEDSLVSTVGLLSGVAIAGIPKPAIVISGVVLIFVEAFSMGAGSFISEHSAEEYAMHRHHFGLAQLIGAVIMFFSYFISGFIPLAPYIFIDVKYAFWASIGASLLAMFLLGIINGKIFKIKKFRHALEIVLIGGIAIAVGALVGRLFKNDF